MKVLGFPPISVLLTWPQPNYENPENRGGIMAGIDITMTAITTIIVAVRIAIRIQTRTFWWDDVLVALAMPFAIAMVAVSFFGHWGVHIWDIPFSEISWTIKCLFITQLCSAFSHYLNKISILLFYRRLFGPHVRAAQLHVNIGFVITALLFVISVLVVVFQCWPIRAIWELTLQPRKCINTFAMMEAMVVLACGLNFYMFCIPIPFVLKLQINKKTKMGLVVIFTVGFLACIVSTVKVVITAIPFTVEDWDFTWYGMPASVLCVIENDLTLIASSMPALKHLLNRRKQAKIEGYATKASANSDFERRAWTQERERTTSAVHFSTLEGVV